MEEARWLSGTNQSGSSFSIFGLFVDLNIWVVLVVETPPVLSFNYLFLYVNTLGNFQNVFITTLSAVLVDVRLPASPFFRNHSAAISGY